MNNSSKSRTCQDELHMFDSFIHRLEKKLRQDLPGEEAQAEMAPYERPVKFDESTKTKARKGGVLILLYPHEDEICFPLMRRPLYEGVHSRQISLPGGKVEKEDGTLIQTALRETEEELGVDQQKVTVIGELTELYIPPSNFLVQPVVGYTTERPVYKPDPLEVDEIIETSLEYLQQSDVRKMKKMKLSNQAIFETPYFDVNDNVVWGATAMMLSEFIKVVKTVY